MNTLVHDMRARARCIMYPHATSRRPIVKAYFFEVLLNRGLRLMLRMPCTVAVAFSFLLTLPFATLTPRRALAPRFSRPCFL